MRNYPEAERYADRAISLASDWLAPTGRKAWIYVSSQGNTEKARATLEEVTHGIGTRDYFNEVLFRWILIDIFEGKYQDALDRLSSLPAQAFESQSFFLLKDQLYAQIYGLMNQPDLERVALRLRSGPRGI